MAPYIRVTDYKQRARAFEEIGGEVVQSVSFVLEKWSVDGL
jgi:hypothetical protein